MNKAPVLFLVFNREDTTTRVFETIRTYQPSRLYLASDGPRNDKINEDKIVEAVRRTVLDHIDWPCEVKTLLRTENLGCKNAVSTAISWFFDQEEEGIILEDDCLPHPDFFPFCNSLLEYHRDNQQVMFISGDNFQEGKKWGDGSYYYSRFAHIWGWAGWRRSWEKYSLEIPRLEEFRKNRVLFNIFGDKKIEKYFLKKFDLVKKNRINTWDYQLQYSIWANNGICILPNVNLVRNIGINIGSGTNTNKYGSAQSITTNKLGTMVHPLFQVPELEADLHTAYTNYIFSIKKIRKVIQNL